MPFPQPHLLRRCAFVAALAVLAVGGCAAAVAQGSWGHAARHALPLPSGGLATARSLGGDSSSADIAVTPEALTFELGQGDAATQTFTISNEAGPDSDSLECSVAVREVGGAGAAVEDGSFEAGTPNPFWDEGSTNFDTLFCTAAVCNTGGGTGALSGAWWVWFGGSPDTTETGFVEQEVTVPAGSAELRFYHEIPIADVTGFMSVQLDGEEVFRTTDADGGAGGTYETYRLVTLDVSAYADGGTHTLRFESTTEAGEAGAVTNFFVDLVSLEGTGPMLLSVSPSDCGDGIAPGASLDVTATADAEGAEAGIHDFEVVISSNDPDEATVTVDVTVNVTPVSNEGGLIPTAFGVEQNYPNPFAERTTLEFALPEASDVSVRVYDTAGHLVATLVDAERPAGYHEVEWDAARLASGVYLVRVEAGAYTGTVQAVVVR